MRSFAPLAVLANLALVSAAVLPQVQKRSLLSALGVATSSNTGSSAWVGSNGPYTGEFINDSAENIELVIWGPAASWVNADTPLVTYALAPKASVTVSFASGLSGGFSAVYADTELVNGQVSNTWGEFTFNGEYSTFDVSRMVNMDGNDLSIVVEECTSNMDTCVFTCPDSTTCMTGYELTNCATGSQAGAEYGTYDGAASGGCLVGSANKIVATFA